MNKFLAERFLLLIYFSMKQRSLIPLFSERVRDLLTTMLVNQNE